MSDDALNVVKRTISSNFPDARISIIDNKRDNAGGLLYVNNVPEDFQQKFSDYTSFVSVPLKSEGEAEYIVIPIQE